MARTLDDAGFSRHRVSELNRGGAEVFDEAAAKGVLLAATGGRPELVMLQSSEWARLQSLREAAWLVADAIADANALLRGQPIKPNISWLAALEAPELEEFVEDVTRAGRLARDLDNAEPLRSTLHRWRSTAEYVLAGSPLSPSIDWEAVLALARPEDGPEED